MRQVALFWDAEEAQIARGFLRSHGIDAQLPDEQALSVMPELRFGLGGYRLLVPEAEHFSASALLRDAKAGAQEAVCDECGGGPLRRIRDWTLPAVMTALFGFLAPFAPATGDLRCSSCGHRQTCEEGDEDPERDRREDQQEPAL